MKPLRYKYQTFTITNNFTHLRTLKYKQKIFDKDNNAEDI